MVEKEKQVMTRLNRLVEKQRHQIQAKDHELTLKNDDIEAVSVFRRPTKKKSQEHMPVMTQTVSRF